MKMSDHQKRLWQGMIDEIQHYLDGETENFINIVGRLEGAIDASDIKDDLLIYQWYEFWTPLEIRSSIEGNNVNKQKAFDELIRTRDFLLKNK